MIDGTTTAPWRKANDRRRRACKYPAVSLRGTVPAARLPGSEISEYLIKNRSSEPCDGYAMSGAFVLAMAMCCAHCCDAAFGLPDGNLIFAFGRYECENDDGRALRTLRICLAARDIDYTNVLGKHVH